MRIIALGDRAEQQSGFLRRGNSLSYSYTRNAPTADAKADIGEKAVMTATKNIIPRGKPPLPIISTCHDVRHLVVCAYARCRDLGDERDMVTAKSTDFQSKSDGRACYHGRCYAKKYGLAKFLRLPKKTLSKLTLGDLGSELMKAVAREHSKNNARQAKRIRQRS